MATSQTQTMTATKFQQVFTVFDYGDPYQSVRRPKSPKLGDFSKIYDLGLLPHPSTKITQAAPTRPRSPMLFDSTGTRTSFLDGLNIPVSSQPIHFHTYNAESLSTKSDDSPARDSILSDVFATTNSTPGSSPQVSSEARLKKNSIGYKATPQTAKPHYIINPTTSFPKDVLTGSEQQHVAYWDAWKKNTPAYLNEEAKFDQLRQTEYKRILDLQTRMQNLPHGVSFSVPWSIYTPCHDYTSDYIATVPWSSGIGAQVGPKPVSRDAIDPLYQVPKDTQLAILKAALDDEYLKDVNLRRNQTTCGVAPNGPIHIFVDLSNIIIGFYDCLKMKRGIPANQRMRAPPFFFEAFASVLERKRGCAKKVLAGSIRAGGSQPGYMMEASLCGYEMNIMQRVPKSPAKHHKKKNQSGNSDTTSSDSSEDARGKAYYPLKHGEQGVDELLHLKITQSILDAKQPATMVIATGDAAEAEFSDGFLKNAERALERGWCVELVAWSKGISSSWRNPEFTQKWEDRFRIIELDLIAEELLGWYLRQA